jgi:uncharacterized membrane protein YcaP (DUF421 family)
MNDVLVSLFGVGTSLTATQMALRGMAVFVLTLLMLRISGRRSLGQHTSFDTCITVLLGSILARAVVGASPFAPTIATGVALVLLHRAIAMVSVRSHVFDFLVNGHHRTLVTQGNVDRRAMRRGLVSQADLLQALREHSVPGDPSLATQVVLERNGVISVIKG